ncbi:hypothetical protein DPMN_088665 [Dreissena polymorpha]|uniref:Uncharacterized protein n=1 Tax=Dreissena polymorpha TaxID=45954 RepID=A0A9D4KVG4_DREPO|nr:hypothetical protein DPMN_088665 [Dreissena polymorpha]
MGGNAVFSSTEPRQELQLFTWDPKVNQSNSPGNTRPPPPGIPGAPPLQDTASTMAGRGVWSVPDPKHVIQGKGTKPFTLPDKPTRGDRDTAPAES